MPAFAGHDGAGSFEFNNTSARTTRKKKAGLEALPSTVSTRLSLIE